MGEIDEMKYGEWCEINEGLKKKHKNNLKWGKSHEKKFITCLQNWGQIELIADLSCSFGIRQAEEKGHLSKNINEQYL